MAPKTNLRLASFDSGGIRGLSLLEIMKHIMHELTWDNELNESDERSLPCEHFDLIGGSGTGGLIAILFVKLRMSVEEASEEFYNIIKHVFNPKGIPPSQRTEALRKCMEDILKRKKLPVDLPLREKEQEGCGSFVVASPYTDAKGTDCLRTYSVRRKPPSYITVVEAVLATCATQPDFASMTFGTGYKAREYIAASGATNPIYEVITEAHLRFGGDASIASLLSLGTGHTGVISLPQGGSEAALYRIMRDMMDDCEQRAQEIEERIGRVGVYSRFSVDQGMQANHVGQLEDPSWISAQTENYLGRHDTGERLDFLTQCFGVEKGPITLDQLRHAGGPNAPGHVATIVQRSLEILISNQDDDIIAKLKPKDLECESKVEMCLEGTRQDILQNIRIWVADLEAPNILWVNGYPGVGKSAIASTIVEELHSSNRCGSSFFFQRERASAMTPSAFWCKVAYDLARRYPGIRKHIVTALIANESFPTTLNIDALFRELISEPLTKSDEIPIDKLPVIVLDALDECGGIDGWRSDHRKKLIRTLKSWSSLSRRFKLVVTSRWEEDIERLFSTISHHPVEVFSGEKANSASAVDIRTFLLHELGQLLDRYPSLPSDWPGEEEIVRLINGANGMFIWIKTVIKLLESGEPRRTLRQVLSNGAGSMADLYAWILHASFPKPSGDDVKDFKSALGAVIFAKEPLDVANLAHFLSIDGSTMEYICNGLKSVLDCGKIIRVRHQSFVDFLLDSKECPPAFLLSKSREATSLALCCLNTMKQHLKFNICDLESSYVRNQDVPNLAQRVDECIPPYLSYSSRYWTTHLADTPFNNDIRNGVKYFMDYQFLWWLETMSLLKRISIGPNMLHSLINWLQKANQDDSLATDMQKFAAAFASVISQSTPHIYISAIAFAPRSLGVSKQYLSQYPQTLTVRSGGCNSWSSIQSIDIDHKDLFLSVSISSDGKRIVSGSSDRTVRIWDAETGQTILGPLHGHSHSVYSASFSPDGKRVVSCSSDHTIRVWDAETGGTVLDPLHGHRDAVNSVSFSPDGKRIVSGSSDHMIRVWDAETGEMVLGPLRGHRDSVNSVSLSPDGKRIASGSMDAKIRVWDAETGEVVLGPLQGHSHSVWSVSFSPDGKRIVSGSMDDTIRVWDAETGQTVLGPLHGHSDSVYSVSFAPDGKRIVSGSMDCMIRVWDAETGKMVLGPLQRHSGVVHSVSFSPNGKRIVSGAWDHTIHVWDAETGQMVLGLLQRDSDSVSSVSFLPDGSRIVSDSSDHNIRVWDGEIRQTVPGPLQGHSHLVRSVSFSPDGKRIISGSMDKTIRVWNAETGGMVLGPLRGHNESVNFVTFSQDGKRIVSGSSDRTIRVWSAETGDMILDPLRGHSHSVNSVSFSPDGKRIASGSTDAGIRVWDAETGEVVLGPLQGHSHSVWSVSFSPDGKRIVSGSMDDTIRVWDAETGETILGPLHGHSDSVYSVSFSPDGKRILSGSRDHTIRIWDAETGEMNLFPLQGHSHSVMSASFSSDGNRIVSGGWDHTIRVWNAETGQTILGPLRGHSHSVNSVSFSPNGNRIVSGSMDATIRVWDAAMDEMTVDPFLTFNPDVKSVSSYSDEGSIVSDFDIGSISLRDADAESNGYSKDIYATFRQTAKTENGWIRGPNSELLFWVPPGIRPRLCQLGHILVIDREKVWTVLDLQHFVHGNKWSRCKDHRVT